MFKKILSIFLFTIIFATPAFAGRDNNLPHGKWWNNTQIVDQLHLSKNEVTILDDMYVNHRRKSIKLRAVLEEEQFELNHLIDSKTIDDQAVLNQAKKLEEARSSLSTERFHFFLDVRKLLGFDRYQQLKTMFQSMRDNKKAGRFKKMKYKRNNRFEQNTPLSYNRHSRSGRAYDHSINRDIDSPEHNGQPIPNVPPYEDKREITEKNL